MSLVLRLPQENEEEEFLRAHRATSPGYPSFARSYQEGMPFTEYLRDIASWERAENSPYKVPATFLFAFVADRIVGRVSIRHTLSGGLRDTGGHIGYVVVPEFRRRGFATEILGQALRIARDRAGLSCVLVTCDEGNVGSMRTIERCGGVLQDVVNGPGLEKPKRRYWIEVEEQ